MCVKLPFRFSKARRELRQRQLIDFAEKPHRCHIRYSIDFASAERNARAFHPANIAYPVLVPVAHERQTSPHTSMLC